MLHVVSSGKAALVGAVLGIAGGFAGFYMLFALGLGGAILGVVAGVALAGGVFYERRAPRARILISAAAAMAAGLVLLFWAAGGFIS